MIDYPLGSAKRRAELGSARRKQKEMQQASATIKSLRRTYEPPVQAQREVGTVGSSNGKSLPRVIKLSALASAAFTHLNEHPPPKFDRGDYFVIKSIENDKLVVEKINVSEFRKELKLNAS